MSGPAKRLMFAGTGFKTTGSRLPQQHDDLRVADLFDPGRWRRIEAG